MRQLLLVKIVYSCYHEPRMKAIEVAAAVIIEQDRVFAARRGAHGPLGGKWEFPGGKLERGESAQDAVVRELFEELGTVITVCRDLVTVRHEYPWFTITMHALLCERVAGDLVLTEHQESRWLEKSELYTLDWAEADLPILPYVEGLLDG